MRKLEKTKQRELNKTLEQIIERTKSQNRFLKNLLLDIEKGNSEPKKPEQAKKLK